MQRKRLVLAAAAATALLVLGGAAYALADDGAVRVEQAYFLAAEPAAGELNLTASLFLSNRGGRASDAVSLAVFVVPQDTGLAAYRTRLDVGRVGDERTTEVQVPVRIPEFNATRGYRIDFLVLEDGLLTQKGSGHVGWGGGHWYGGDAVAGDRSAKLSVSAPTFERVG